MRVWGVREKRRGGEKKRGDEWLERGRERMSGWREEERGVNGFVTFL